MAASQKYHVVADGTKEDAYRLFKELIDLCSQNGNVIELYDQWAPQYDQYMSHADYHGPQMAAARLAEILPDKSARVLDVAAGTGLSGIELKKVGFNNIDALDGSQKMLDEAKKKGVYNELICAVVGTNKPTDIPDGTYSAVLQCGGGHLAHVPGLAFNEFVGILKPGGVVCFLYAVELDETDGDYAVSAPVSRLRDAGSITDVSYSDELPDYWIGTPARIVTFTKI